MMILTMELTEFNALSKSEMGEERNIKHYTMFNHTSTQPLKSTWEMAFNFDDPT